QDKVVTEEEEGKSVDTDVNSQADENDKTMSADEEESVSVDKIVSADKHVPDKIVDVDDCDFIDQPLQKSFKMKEVPNSDSDYDVEPDVPDIVPSTRKKIAGKKVPLNVHAAPMDNVSFH
ncbi:hypothetical protein A2U01_0061812, partial [Trifolium medium]|nr:hypothetical protein [Trifolium medium]